MSKASEISRSILKADGNVIVMIRGGGEASDFAEFEALLGSVCPLAKKQAYRVLGIGHSRTATVLDLVCECSESTPSAAGTHLRDMALPLFIDALAVRKLNEERDQLRSELAAIRREHGTALEAAAREKDISREFWTTRSSPSPGFSNRTASHAISLTMSWRPE
jgi:exonuclease VII large subunit